MPLKQGKWDSNTRPAAAAGVLPVVKGSRWLQPREQPLSEAVPAPPAHPPGRHSPRRWAGFPGLPSARPPNAGNAHLQSSLTVLTSMIL